MEYTLMINPEICTGCRLCELACSFYHEHEFNPTKSRIRVVKEERHGIDIPVVCVHCSDPPCMKVCPVGAISRDSETGGIMLESDKCITCKACMMVCPYSAMSIHPSTGKAMKCDLCKSIGELKCVRFCTIGALEYVDKHKLSPLRRKQLVRKIEDTLERARW